MRARSLCLAGLLLLALLAGEAEALCAEPPTLAGRLDRVANDQLLSSASVGILVVVTRTGEVLYERDADRSLMPASNMKLVTTATALDLLGRDFCYTTEVCSDRPVSGQGWVVGDLFLRGSGDPTLSHADLDRFASRLAARGLTRVTGSIIADDTCFAGPPLGAGWSWDNETYAYSAQVSGLTVEGGVVLAEVRPGAEPGAPCELVLDPPSDYLRLDRGCVTGPSDCKRPVVFRRRAENVVATTGPVPLGERVSARVSVEEPALYAASLLGQSLAKHHIRVSGAPVRGATPASSVVLVEHSSQPLSEIVRMMNKPSENNIAEALLRTIPRAIRKPGTADAGTEAVSERLAEWGIDTGPLRLCDGSGLSRYNLLTARALVDLLRRAASEGNPASVLADSLPVAGVDGTLRSRMRGTAAEGMVRAKTGSLRGVRGLSGYVDGAEERTLTFSFLVNNYTCSGSAVQGLQDRACAILAEYAME